MLPTPDLIRRGVRAGDVAAELERSCAVVLSGWFTDEECARWVRGVQAARDAWTHDFGGEQYSLGRAFYTHYEEGKSAAYFDDPAASDALVERHAPGLQAAMRDLVARVTSAARVVPRRGWCGPGVHVFPPRGPVSSRGGVVHFDTEGLTSRHAEALRPAITIVGVLQSADGGGLRVWNVRYSGHDHPTAQELAAENAVVEYRVGDVVVIDSYRLHQIQPFDGDRERITATTHAAEIDHDLWEHWF